MSKISIDLEMQTEAEAEECAKTLAYQLKNYPLVSHFLFF